MKKMKSLLTFVVVVVSMTILFTVTTMAADETYFKFENSTIDYSTGSIQIDVVAAQEFTTPAAEVAVEYDADVWKISSVTTGGGATTASGKKAVTIQNGTLSPDDMVTFAKGDVILKFKATPIAPYDATESVEGKNFKFIYARILNEEAEDYAYVMSDLTGSVVITDSRFAAQIEIKSSNVDAAATIETATAKYINVWKGTYTVALNGLTWPGATINFAEKNIDISTVAVEGEGDINFTVAILGVPATAGNGELTLK